MSNRRLIEEYCRSRKSATSRRERSCCDVATATYRCCTSGGRVGHSLQPSCRLRVLVPIPEQLDVEYLSRFFTDLCAWGGPEQLFATREPRCLLRVATPRECSTCSPAVAPSHWRPFGLAAQ